MADEDKMHSIALGDWVREMVAAGESREEADGVIAAAARFTWWGEDCREVYGLSRREWAVLTREQSRLNPGKRTLSPAELEQRRNAAQNAGRPPKQKSEEIGEIGGIGEIGPSQREEEERDEEKREIQPVDEDARKVPAVGGFSPPSGSADFAAWAATQKDPVAVALAASGEGADKAKVYGARLRELRALKGGAEGDRLFVAECVTFHAELRAGEECRNPGAALVARLKSLREALKGGATVAPTATPPRATESEPVAAPPRETPHATAPEPPRVSVAAILAEAERRGARNHAPRRPRCVCARSRRVSRRPPALPCAGDRRGVRCVGLTPPCAPCGSSRGRRRGSGGH